MKLNRFSCGSSFVLLAHFCGSLAIGQNVPTWWNLYEVNTGTDTGNHSPANVGQLRMLGVAAAERLVTDHTNGTTNGPDQTSLERYQALRTFTGSNYSMVNCGQVLNIADALRLRATGSSVPLSGSSAYSSVANLGQLKNAFDFQIGGSDVRQMPPSGTSWGTAPWQAVAQNPRVERERKFRATGASPSTTGLVEGDLASYAQNAQDAISDSLTQSELGQWQLDNFYTDSGGTSTLATIYKVTPGDPDEQWFVDIYFDTPTYVNYRNNIATRIRVRFDELFNGTPEGASFNALLELNKWLTGGLVSLERIEFQSKSSLRTGYDPSTMPSGAFRPDASGYYEVRQYRDFYRPGGGTMLHEGQRTGASIRNILHPFQNGGQLVSQCAPEGTAYRWANLSSSTNDDKVAASSLNNGSVSDSINLMTGTSSNTDATVDTWAGGGVIFSATRTINALEFVHGEVGSSGNKGFYDDAANPPRAQYLNSSDQWVDIPNWSSTPLQYPDNAYPFSNQVEDKTYFCSGPAVTAKGFRILGKLIRQQGTWVKWSEFRCYEESAPPAPSNCGLGYLTALYGAGLVPSTDAVKLVPKAIIISQRKRTRLRIDNSVRDHFRTQFGNPELGGELLLMTLDIAHVFDPVQVLSRMQNPSLTPGIPTNGRITDDAASAGRVGMFTELEFQVDEEWSPAMTSNTGLSDALQKDLEHLSVLGRTGSGLTTVPNFKTKYQEAVQTLWQADVFHTLTELSPRQAAGNSQVVIQGQNFAPSTTGNSVSIGGTTATVVTASQTQLTVIVPSGLAAGFQPVTCTVSGRTSTCPHLLLIQ